MWESPIRIIEEGLQTQITGEVFSAIRRVGFDIDKDELVKALNYDRNQYAKGYKEGYSDAKSELVRCKDCKHYISGSDDVRYCFNHDDDILWQDDDFCSRAERREE